MTKARDIMTPAVEHLSIEATGLDAAKTLAKEGVGVVPVCEPDGHLRGVVTDRDLVVGVLAEGKDPASVRLGELIGEEAVTIGADDSLDLAIKTMQDHKVRRLPVIDGQKLVGIISQADIARACPPDKIGDLVSAISE